MREMKLVCRQYDKGEEVPPIDAHSFVHESTTDDGITLQVTAVPEERPGGDGQGRQTARPDRRGR